MRQATLRYDGLRGLARMEMRDCGATVALTQGLCDDRENILWNSRMPNLYKAKLFLMNLMWLL